jgi:hypothetical protein
MQAVRDGVGREIEERYEDGGYIILVFCYPRGRKDTIWEDGSTRRERGYGRVQNPRSSSSDGRAAWWCCIGCGWGISFLRWQLKGLQYISIPACNLATCTHLPSLQHVS